MIQILNNDILDIYNHITQQVGAVPPQIQLIFILGIVLLWSTIPSYKGPGGKNILNEESKLEQDPILEQKQKDKSDIRRVELRIHRRQRRPYAHPGGSDGIYNTVLYEPADPSSATIISANILSPQPIMPITPASIFGIPQTVRVGLAVNTVNFQGIAEEPRITTWSVNSQPMRGIECKALYLPGVLFTDKSGRPIIYNGNKMILPP